ncbi:MAG: hypothetical protein E4H09_03430 [Spirochaetales bacterium]|nr:MAG: hypothetical protein E4H09_03430 [Spirochaetales bacterium]
MGETAPLIMIGAAASVFTRPRGLFSGFNALPLPVYAWSDFPREGFQHGVTPTALEKHVQIVTNLSGNNEAWGNPNLLEQALVNLVDNAIKYGGSGDRPVVSLTAHPATLEISVTDQGAGTQESDLPRIFERFYRTDNARSRELGGTGLGLAIVKHIANADGGEVSVQSTFTVTIPQPPPV